MRVTLSLLILASLVPHPAESVTDLVFFVVFGLELSLRVVVLVQRRRSQHRDVRTTRRRALSTISLVIDLVALMSFVPWSDLTGLAQARWLRFLRLLRMLLLVGYWAPTLRDSWQVLTRHDRMRQVTLLGLIVGLLAFAGAAVLSHIPVDGTDFNGDAVLDDADQSFWPRLWWAFRQVQDPGNMVSDPGELVVVIASLMLTVAGLFVVSFLIGLATDIVRELVAIARNRPVGWKGHTVLVHATPGLPRLLSELNAFYERLFRRPQLVVADGAEEPPSELRTGELARIRWRTIGERGEGLVHHTDVASARRVVVLAKPDAPFPDAHAVATVLDLREANAHAWLVVEVLDPNNAAAVRVAGGSRTILVSTEKMLGIWALAATRRPEQIAAAWDLLATRGGSEVYTFFYDADGLAGPGAPWHPGSMELDDLAPVTLAEWRRQRERRRPEPLAVAIGVVYAGADHVPGASHEAGELVLAPRPVQSRPARALVAIADHFELVRDMALELHSGELALRYEEEDDQDLSLATGAAADPVTPRRVLICGFRPATVIFCAGILSDRAGAEIVVAMRHQASVAQAAQAFREHDLKADESRCLSGRFMSLADSDEEPPRFTWIGASEAPDATATGAGTIALVRADWTSERTLRGLGPSIEHVGSYDLVVMMGSHLPEYDGRNAIACLKIADLARLAPERFVSGHRVVVGIADPELGRRLTVSFARAVGEAGPKVTVLPTEDLRALFMFQAIAVPGWESIFIELLGPGGHGLLRLPIDSEASRPWSFVELLLAARGRGVLFAVELADGRRLYGSSGDQGPWLERDLRALWLVGEEQADDSV